MHILQAAMRRAKAQERLVTAAQNLAEKYNLPAELIAGLTIQEKDPLVKSILTIEATANLLEALVNTDDHGAPGVPPKKAGKGKKKTIEGA
jgi:hypothetical protein